MLAETLRLHLTAFDVAPDGTLSNRRVWASTAPQMETSQIAYACALGGLDGRTLFAMTAPTSEGRAEWTLRERYRPLPTA